MHKVNEIKLKNGNLVNIYQDTDPLNPRIEWDNLGEMICFHDRYQLGDKHNYQSPEEAENSIEKDDIVLPLFLYDHSGLTMSTAGFSCPWDSGQVGIIIARKKKYENEGLNAEQAKKILISEVETYDQYLRGDIYGFEIVKINQCETCENNEHEVIDSCWGFYGDDPEQNGMMEHWV